MSRYKRKLVCGAVLAALGLTSTQVHAICTFGSSGEPSLQGTFDTFLGGGALSAVNACVDDGDDVAWAPVGSIGAVDIVVELAGNAATNRFGVYDVNDPTRTLTVFEGSDGVGAGAEIRLRQLTNGSWRVSVREVGTVPWTHLAITTSAFGFYLSNRAQGTFYSDTTRNADGVDHMYAYQGNGAAWMSGVFEGEVFTPNDYILAWEDLLGGGDRDYQDFMVVVQDITPVPLPTAAWLLVSGLIGLAGVSRRGS